MAPLIWMTLATVAFMKHFPLDFCLSMAKKMNGKQRSYGQLEPNTLNCIIIVHYKWNNKMNAIII